MVGSPEGHPACENLFHSSSEVLFQKRWRGLEGNRLTQVHLEKRPLNRTNGVSKRVGVMRVK